MEIKKKRPKPVTEEPNLELDLAGPAAWGEASADLGRRKKPAPKKRRPKTEEPSDSPPRSKTPRAVKPRRKKSLFGGFWTWVFWTAISFGLVGVAVLFLGYHYFAQDLPSVEGLKAAYTPPTVTYFYSDDGRVIGEYYHERRFVLPLNMIPPHVRNAFLAVEDSAFYEHHGINPKAILRAAIANFTSGGTTQGGSTITQQIIKTFLLTPERSYRRKFKEMILAWRIENYLTKDEILYLYLNQIYLGRGAYGVEAAARTYFDKGAADLTIAEAAMLAGITQAPSHNPVSNPQRARDRQDHGIDRLLETGFITPTQAAQAKAEVLTVIDTWRNPNPEVTPYFTEHVRRMMEERFGAESLYNDGWRVYTTVNIEAQHAADRAVAQGLWEYGRRRGYKGPVKELIGQNQINDFLAKIEKELPPEGVLPDRLYQAVVLKVDNGKRTLDVQVGPVPGHISRANLEWALKGGKSMASSFKAGDVIWVRLDENGSVPSAAAPVLRVEDLAALIAQEVPQVKPMILEQRTDLQSALLSLDLQNGDVKAMVGGRDFNESQFNRATQSQRQPGSSFKPILYASALDNGFTPGSVMNDAPFVVDNPGDGRRWKPMNSDLKFKGPISLYTALIGSRNIISIKLLDRIGFDAFFQTVKNLGIDAELPRSLTLALGAYGFPMPELLTAYSAFPNMGMRVEPRYITKIEDRFGNVVATFEPQRIPSLDPGTACSITWMLQGAVAEGTGRSVKSLGRPVAGKTGTTNDYSDAWFVGFTPELLTAVWVGTDQQRPRAVGEVGGRAAAPIFLYYMQEALQHVPPKDFVVPPEAELVEGGALGICYKLGTVGTGLSETIVNENPQDDFLQSDFDEFIPGVGPDGQPLQGGLTPPGSQPSQAPGRGGAPEGSFDFESYYRAN